MPLGEVIKWDKGRMSETIDNLLREHGLNHNFVIINFDNVGSNKSKNLIVYDKKQLHLLKQNIHGYEVIPKQSKCKIFFDMDRCEVSYNMILQFIKEFNTFMRLIFQTETTVNFNIHVSSNQTKINKTASDKFINSFHLIGDAYVSNIDTLKYVIGQFKDYSYLEPYGNLDMSVYCKNKRIRTLFQSKFESDKILKRIECKNKMVNFTNEFTGDDLITIIDDNNKFISIDLPTESDTNIIDNNNFNYRLTNFKYDINNHVKLNNELNSYDEDDFSNKNKWHILLYKILIGYYLRCNNFTNVFEDTYLIEFLQKSKVKNYKNSYKTNITYINTILQNPSNILAHKYKSFELLENNELEFIFYKLQNHYAIDETTEIKIKKVNLNNKPYFKFINMATNNEYGLWDISNSILATEFIVITENKKHIIKANNSYSFAIENLKFYDRLNDVNYIDDLNKVKINANTNTYVIAPTGSGKSYLVLQKDLQEILNDNEAKILIITDTRSMAEKTCEDLYNYNIDKSIIKFYKDDTIITEATRIIITCYNSLKKFETFNHTHIIIDEYKNVTNSFTNVIGNVKKQDYKELFNHFIGAMIKAKSIKLYDANINDYDITFLTNKGYLNKEFDFYHLHNYKQKNNKIILQSSEITLNEINKSIKRKKNVIIAVTSREKAMELEKSLSKLTSSILYMDKNGANDGSHVSTDEERIALKAKYVRNTDLWANFQVVIYTPTIMTGISFNTPNHFDKNYLLLTSGGSDYLQSSQMINRNRQNDKKELIISIFQDRLTTFNNREVTSEYWNKYANIKQLHSNLNNNANSKYLKNIKTGLNAELKKTKDFYRYYEIINDYKQSICNKVKLYKILETLYNWGHNEISLNWYARRDPKNNVIQDLLNEEEIKVLARKSTIEIHKEIFKKAKYIHFKLRKGDTINNDTLKSIELQKYGFTPLMYNKINETNNQADEFYFMFHMDKQINQTLFKNISLLRFYDVKELFYYYLDNFLLHNDIKEVNKYIYQNYSIDIVKEKIKKLLAIVYVFKTFQANDINMIEIIEFCKSYNEFNLKTLIYSEFYTQYEAYIKYCYSEKLTPRDLNASLFMSLGIKASYKILTIEKVCRFQKNIYFNNRASQFNTIKQNLYDDQINEVIENNKPVYELKEYTINNFMPSINIHKFNSRLDAEQERLRFDEHKNMNLLYHINAKISEKLQNDNDDDDDDIFSAYTSSELDDIFNYYSDDTMINTTIVSKHNYKELPKIPMINVADDKTIKSFERMFLLDEIITIEKFNEYIELKSKLTNDYNKAKIIYTNNEMIIPDFKFTFNYSKTEPFSEIESEIFKKDKYEFEVSNLGRIKLENTIYIPETMKYNNIMYNFILYKNVYYRITSLVFETFVKLTDKCIKHIDCNFLNDLITNLQECDQDEDLICYNLSEAKSRENLYVQAEKIRATERNEKVTCEFCGNEYQIKNKARHCKSAKHLKGK